MDWYGVEDMFRLEKAWPDAPIDNRDLCGLLMDTAREQVIAYAPEDDAPAAKVSALLSTIGYPAASITAVLDLLEETQPAVRSRYVFAQLMQAKNLYNAGRIVGDSVGPEGFSFVPRPLSREIQRVIRPQSGIANVL